MDDPKCVMDSLFRIQDKIRKDPKIKEEDKLTDSDMQLMFRDVIIAGKTHISLHKKVIMCDSKRYTTGGIACRGGVPLSSAYRSFLVSPCRLAKS